jgi:hypothetical protein
MTVTDVLKSEAGKSTVTTGYVSSYSMQRDGRVIAYVQARLENWRLVWSIYSTDPTGRLTSKSAVSLSKLLADFGAVDLTPTDVAKPEMFFQTLPKN